MVSTTNYIASFVASQVLNAGGTAADASVAAALCLHVVEPHMTSLGGVAPALVFEAATGQVACLAGVGVWPRTANIPAVRARLDADVPVGIAMALVPASVAAWVAALDRWGRWSFAEVARPALDLAREGFPASRSLAEHVWRWQGFLADWPGCRAYYPSGRPLKEGEILRQPDLADTLQELIAAERGAADRPTGLARVRRAFYEGQIAEHMVDFSRRHGGFLEMEDLANFNVGVESPVAVGYRGFHVLTTPPWSQGPALLQVLTILERRWARRAPIGAQWYHTLVEATKLAFADRERYYGDPSFVNVPLERLLSSDYAAAQAARIRDDAALPVETLGLDSDGFAVGDTAHVTVVDAEGNVFSATPSDGWADVPSPVVDGLGFNISPRGSQSRLDPDHPAAVGPGRRPRVTPCVAMVLRDGRPWLVLGTPGGDMQCQALAQVLVRIIDHGWSGQAAVEAPRVGMLAFPGSFYPHESHPYLWVEPAIPRRVQVRLLRIGHEIRRWPPLPEAAGGVCGVAVNPASGVLEGFADPRRNSCAIGW